MSEHIIESDDQAMNGANIAQKRMKRKEALHEYFTKEKFRKDIIENLEETSSEIQEEQDEETHVEKIVMINEEAKNLIQISENGGFTDEQYELLINYKISEEELMMDENRYSGEIMEEFIFDRGLTVLPPGSQGNHWSRPDEMSGQILHGRLVRQAQGEAGAGDDQDRDGRPEPGAGHQQGVRG